VPVQVTVTVWPALEGTVMLLVAGLDASAVPKKDERVIVAMIAVTATQATAARMMFVRKLSDLMHGFSESCDMRFLLRSPESQPKRASRIVFLRFRGPNLVLNFRIPVLLIVQTQLSVYNG